MSLKSDIRTEYFSEIVDAVCDKAIAISKHDIADLDKPIDELNRFYDLDETSLDFYRGMNYGLKMLQISMDMIKDEQDGD